ncbi:MAG: hydantoinase B/oxoprolinase family protein, partial [Candidatus Thermoplasmatota archaeon]
MDPVELEVLRNAVTFVPEEMGIALRRTAYSPNIKERMDASCAVFNGEGRMLAQAEHIPVHLGSMPVTIDVLREEMGGDLADGDQVIVNDPYRGGSHLPDITLVRPIFYRGTLRGYAVNKAHHADVGGSAPGSMPADSVVLADEVHDPDLAFRGRERAERLGERGGGVLEVDRAWIVDRRVDSARGEERLERVAAV